MNIIIIAAAIIVIIGGTLYRQKITSTARVPNTPTPTAKAPTGSPVPTPLPTLIPTRLHPTNTPTPYPSATTAPKNTGSQTDFPAYPGATVMERNGSRTVYSTGDTPDTVTAWYESKIKDLGLNARSFVKTNTNGTVNNKLVGASSNMEIRVTITKSQGDVVTRVEVEQKYY